MGYTNYWMLKKEIPQETWGKIVEDCKKLYKHLPKHTDSAGGYYSDKPLYLNGCFAYKLPQFNSKMIHFNGGSCPAKDRVKDDYRWRDLGYKENQEDLGHETFDIRPAPKKCEWGKDSDGFSFCKTSRKPYDLMVKAVLIVCKHYLKDDIDISSDGDGEDWIEAAKFVQSILGYVSEYVVCALI